MNTYSATLYRPREVTQNFVLKHADIEISFRGGLQNGWAMLCHQLVLRGLADGPLHVKEIGISQEHALHLEFPSIAEMAKQPFGSDPHNYGADVESEKAAPTARKATVMTANLADAIGKLSRNSSEWEKLGRKTKSLLTNLGYIEVVGNRAAVTDKGRQAVADFAVPALGDGLSEHQRAALSLLPVAVETYREQVSMRTRGFLNGNGWIVVRDGMVYATKNAPGEWGANAPDLPPVEETEETAVVETVPTVQSKKIARMARPSGPRLTEAWKKILLHVQKGMAARTWDDLHGRTKNGLVKSRVVAVDAKGKPSLTENGVNALDTGFIANEG